jgi:hypothetical protein
MTLGKRSDYNDSKYAGLEIPFPDDVDKAVQVGVSRQPVFVCCRPYSCQMHFALDS